MQIYIIVIIACASVLALLLLLMLVFAFLSEKIAFGKRADKNPLLKYFTAEDFSLSAEPVLLPNGLNGFIYSKSDVQRKSKLIIFCHGMGAGQCEYTTEIAFFCNNGYTVLAVDSRGCGFSEGKNLKGMYSGVQTAVAAIDFAEEKGYDDICLVGHSWGAYSALCASAQRKVNGVVAISAPNTPSKTMQEGAVNMGVLPRSFAALMRPFWWFVNLLKYGVKGNSNAAKCAERNGTPTLLIHGDKDKIVTPPKAVFYKAEGEQITKVLAGGKGHNPYNTENAEKLLAELTAKFKRKDIADIAQFDFKGATEEDKEIMQKILNFIEG